MKKMPVLLLFAALNLGGCAAVSHSPATYTPSPSAAQPRMLARSAEIDIGTGFKRVLRAGSRWVAAGSIAQGTVHKPVGDVLTLEGSHVHEAWLVIDGDRLVGFYLPVERGFTALQSPITLHFH